MPKSKQKTKPCAPHRMVPLTVANNVECITCGFVRHRHPVDDIITIEQLREAMQSASPYMDALTDAQKAATDAFRKYSKYLTPAPFTWSGSSTSDIPFRIGPNDTHITYKVDTTYKLPNVSYTLNIA